MAKKWVYLFSEGNRNMRDLLGGKGAGLAEMTNAGLPVPPGFTVTTEACLAYFQNDHQFPEGMWEQVLESMRRTEEETGKGFGDPKNPLLVSVRSGARASMPGMMDTVLNLGLNDETLKSLIALTGNERFAYDAYRRFLQMFGDVVLGLEHHDFEHALQHVKDARGAKLDTPWRPHMEQKRARQASIACRAASHGFGAYPCFAPPATNLSSWSE